MAKYIFAASIGMVAWGAANLDFGFVAFSVLGMIELSEWAARKLAERAIGKDNVDRYMVN